MTAHAKRMSGIVPDDNGAAMTFAAFERNAGEPVKVWDTRMMNRSPVCEIPPPRPGRQGRGVVGVVGAVAWLVSRPGVLSVGFKGLI